MLGDVVDSSRIWLSIAIDYYQKQDYQGTIRNARRALKYNPKSLPAYSYIAKAFLEMGEVDSALETYRKMTEIFPDRPEGYMGLGYIYTVHKKDYEKAIEYYRKALEVSPDDPDVIFGYAKALEKSGRVDEAHRMYEELISKKPDVRNYLSFAKFLYETGKYAKASEIVEKAYALDSTKQALWLIGYKANKKIVDSLRKLHEHTDSLKVYAEREAKYLEKLLSKEPDNFEYIRSLADAYVYSERGEEAVELLKKIAERRNHSSVYLKLAYVYDEHLKDRANAEKYYRKAIELSKKEGSRRNLAFASMKLGDIYYDRADYLKKKKKYFEAVDMYDRAISYYEKALNQGEVSNPNLRRYISKKIDVARKHRKVAWRRANNIE